MAEIELLGAAMMAVAKSLKSDLTAERNDCNMERYLFMGC